jgi:2-polyprenyl-6-methoxyphenol hydroxylase-like FAD-dependent oxidoreductase
MKENGPDRVIVVGCGPVGAVMAFALTAKEIPVTLLEAELEPARRASRYDPSADRRDACRTGIEG